MKYKYFKPIFIGLSCLLAVSAKADDLKQDRNKITIVQPDNSDAVKAYALTNNVTEGEAERRLKIMGNYNTIFAELNQKYGDSIAGIYFDNGKNFKLVVRTNKPGKPTKEIKNFANGLELPIEVIPNSPRNSQAISNIINNQFNRLSSNIKGLSAIGYDPVKDVLDIYIYEPNESTQQEILSDPKLQKISGLDTNIIFIKTPLSSNALKGGSPINQNMGMMQNLCTAGFSATKNGVDGLLTAAHCSREYDASTMKFTYNGYDGEVAPMKIGAYNKYATTNDIEFIVPETSILVSNIFHITPSTAYTNRPYMEPAVGMSICKYGAVTGQSCGSIVKTDLKAYGKDACPANTANGVMGACSDTFVLVEGPINSLKSVNGDSGGPVFERSTGSPLGIHSASFDKDATTKAVVFSKLKYMSELGVNLKQ